jgi:hypothetical protein
MVVDPLTQLNIDTPRRCKRLLWLIAAGNFLFLEIAISLLQRLSADSHDHH